MRQCFYQNGAFPTLYFDMLTNEIEGKDAKQTCQAVNFKIKTAKTACDQCIPLINETMNIENVPKEIVKSFKDLVKGKKG